jgi:hypothetical protein
MKHTEAVMLGQVHRWALLMGMVMILLAGALLLHSETAKNQTNTVSRVRLQEITANLTNCFVCHTPASAEIPELVHTTIRFPTIRDDTTQRSTAEQLRGQIETRLIDLGNRILDLPVTQDQGSVSVIEDFVQVYETTRNNTDTTYLLNTLHSVEKIEKFISLLEHKAQPLKWASLPATTTQSQVNTAQVAPASSPFAAIAQQITGLHKIHEANWLMENYQAFVPTRIVFASYRRGPPARMIAESVL